MICHVVFYRMKPGFTGADESRLIDEARRRLPLLPGVKKLRAGRNIEPAENGYSMALVMDFEDDAALEAYRVHPDHLFFGQQVAGPLVSEIWRYDFRWE